MKKKLVSLLLLSVLLLSAALFAVSCSSEEVETLYVYNWGEYIADGSEGSMDVNAAFEEYYYEKTGKRISVNYSTFSSCEEMYAKVSSGAVSYDVLIPSDYMIERMVSEDLLAPLDLSKIPNYQYIDDSYKGDNVYYEDNSGNRYSIPYFCGLVGVIYNDAEGHVDPEDPDIGSWRLMFQDGKNEDEVNYRGDVLQFNNSRDAFGTALYYLGYDVNEATEEQWREALDLLKDQKDIVQGYVMDEIFNKMQSGSASVAAYYAGDFLTMYETEGDGNLKFFYPEEGTNVYVDAMCIPKNSKHYDLALEYINFMCEEDIGVENALMTYYASPLTTVVANEDYQAGMAEVHEDAMDILYGETASEARAKAQAYLNLSPEKLVLLNDLWEELKVESSIGTGIYIGCGLVVGAIVGFSVYTVLRKRRWAKLYD